MHLITPKRCEDHRLDYLGSCPMCRAGVEPTRFTEARQDFQGKPVAGVEDLLPHHAAVRLEDVVVTLASQLAEIVRREEEVLRPYRAARSVIVGQIREAGMEPAVFNRAARILAGVPGASYCRDEPHVAAVLGCVDRVRSQST